MSKAGQKKSSNGRNRGEPIIWQANIGPSVYKNNKSLTRKNDYLYAQTLTLKRTTKIAFILQHRTDIMLKEV